MLFDHTLKIRACRSGDFEQILEIERASFPYPYTLDTFKELLDLKAVFLVAEKEKRILGYVIADVVPGGGRGIIISLAVAPECRRRGLGTLLMCKALSELEGRCSRVMLHVAMQNKIGQVFYLKFGFKPMGLIRNYYPNGDDAVVLENNLEKVLEKACSKNGDKLTGSGSQHAAL